MYQLSSITEIKDLKFWFESLNKHGYWVLYRGSEKKPSERVSAGVYESEESGWLALVSNLAMQIKSGGLFTIYISSKETDSSGYTTRFSGNIQMNNEASVGSPFNTESIQGMVTAQVNQQMSDYKKDRRIEDLENEVIEAKKGKRKKGITGIMEEIGEVLEENPTLAGILTPFIHGLGSRFISNVDPQFANVAGAPKRTTIVHESSQDTDAQEEAQEEFSEAEIQTLVDCVNRLAIHFDNPIDLISKFTNYVEENPEKAKMTIGLIIK